MEWLLPLLGGLGAGTLITKITDHFLTRKWAGRDLQYKEKRETYLGLLEAIKQIGISPNDIGNKNDFSVWHMRVQLFGSKACAGAIQGMIDTKPDSEARNKHFEDLIQAMRVDLNVASIDTPQ
jgi:hypothetical protein